MQQNRWSNLLTHLYADEADTAERQPDYLNVYVYDRHLNDPKYSGGQT